MSDYKINFVDELPKNIEKLMQEDLVEYETKHGVLQSLPLRKRPFFRKK